MIARLVSDSVIYTSYKVKDIENQGDDAVYTIYSTVFISVYIDNRLSIILLYGLLTQLKYAQISAFGEYDSLQEVLKTLRWVKILGRSIILVPYVPYSGTQVVGI